MTKLTLDTTPESFFYELIRNAVDHQKVNVKPETEFYLVKLMKRFIFSESLYSKNDDGNMEEQPLVFLYKEALEAEASPTAQKTLFQNVGDISLYKAGFFQESLNHARVDLGYYIGMGEIAYQNAAQRSDEHFKFLFSELSEKFGECVDVLLEVSEKTTVTKTEQDLLRLYEMWSRTGSERAARALKRAGIQLKKENKND